MGSVSAWEAIFMLVVLKIPMVYLAAVVWWAVRAEPAPGDGYEPARAFVPLTPCGWNDWRRGRSRGSRGWRPLRPMGRPGRRVHAPVQARQRPVRAGTPA